MEGEMKKIGVIVLVMMMLVGMSTATSYTVGDSTGWVIPPSASLYSTWASKQNIKVGDVLVFNFKTGAHTVAEVTKSDYDACTFAKPLSTATNGPANMTVKTSGTHYYVCTVGPHCSLGQKVAVTVASSSSSSPTASPAASPKSSPAASPKSSPAASPKSSPATSPSPSPSSDDTPASSPAGSPAATPASAMGPSGSGDTGSSGASSPGSPTSGSSVVEISYGFGLLVLMMSLFFFN